MTHSGDRYFLTSLDDFSRTVWIFLLHEKSEVKSILSRFCQNFLTQFHKKIKSVRTDNGVEFTCLKNYFLDHGIEHQTTMPLHTPTKCACGKETSPHSQHRPSSSISNQSSSRFLGGCILTVAYLTTYFTPRKISFRASTLHPTKI